MTSLKKEKASVSLLPVRMEREGIMTKQSPCFQFQAVETSYKQTRLPNDDMYYGGK